MLLSLAGETFQLNTQIYNEEFNYCLLCKQVYFLTWDLVIRVRIWTSWSGRIWL